MGDERAQTYLRLLAERQARASPRSGPDIARSVEQVRWAGEILAFAGVLEETDVHRIAAELEAALLIRSDLERPRYARRVGWALEALGRIPDTDRWWWGSATPMGITPIGRTIRVAHERVPTELHLMSLVRSPGGMVITAAMRVRWPPDGSCADLEITGAGPHLLPYDQLRAADDRGTGYRVVLSGEGGDLTWQGAIGLPGALPPRARWLDLIADGTQRLVRIELNPADLQPAVAAERATTIPSGERVLSLVAERILASAWDDGGPNVNPRLDEAITVLTAAGALAADSPVPGRLAALYERLGVAEHGISAPPAADLPARWGDIMPGGPPRRAGVVRAARPGGGGPGGRAVRDRRAGHGRRAELLARGGHRDGAAAHSRPGHRPVLVGQGRGRALAPSLGERPARAPAQSGHGVRGGGVPAAADPAVAGPPGSHRGGGDGTDRRGPGRGAGRDGPGECRTLRG